MGVISPVGNDLNTYWNNLLEGVCGIDYIQSVPTDDLPVKIAGEIHYLCSSSGLAGSEAVGP